jgi:hypothetical protein
MLKQNEQNTLRNSVFTEVQDAINDNMFPALDGFVCDGQSTEGLLMFNSEHEQWAVIKLIFKKDGFDGVDAIEEYREKQEEQAEKARKKAEKVAKAQAKREKEKAEAEAETTTESTEG